MHTPHICTSPLICQDYFASLFGHEGVAENAHQFAVMFAGRLERGEGVQTGQMVYKMFGDIVYSFFEKVEQNFFDRCIYIIVYYRYIIILGDGLGDESI